MSPWSRKEPTHQAGQSAEFPFQSTASLRMNLCLHSACPLYTNLLLVIPILSPWLPSLLSSPESFFPPLSSQQPKVDSQSRRLHLTGQMICGNNNLSAFRVLFYQKAITQLLRVFKLEGPSLPWSYFPV